jgi:AraC-like DNA-binding protein
MIYLNLIAVLQSFLFAFLLYKNDNNNILNKLLGVLLLVLGVTVTGNFLLLTNILPDFLNIQFYISQVGCILVAPIIFYYLSLLSGNKISFHPLYIVSFLVFAFLIIISLSFMKLSVASQMLYLNSLFSAKPPDEFVLFSWLYVIVQQVYFSVSWLKIYRYKKMIGEIFSTRSRTRNAFAYEFISFIWILNLLLIVAMFVLPLSQVQFLIHPAKIIVAFSVIIYLAFKQNAIFNEESYDNYLTDVELLQKVSQFKKEEDLTVNLTGNDIKNMLFKEKLFLNPSVTIIDLAKVLGCSHRVVSQVINRDLSQNFSNLINDCRVEEAKLMLKNNPKNLTMEGVGLESGFNSRASFYRVFKQKTKQSPSEFMKEFCN